MRTSQLITQYLQSALFAAIGARVVVEWVRVRERRQAHLALATGLFGISSLIGAVNATIYDSTKAEQPPHAVTAVSTAILLFSVLAFMVFLTDFITTPRWVIGIAGLVTLAIIVINTVERPDLRFDPQRGVVPIPGIDNPISYRAWIGFLLVYLAICFGLMWLAFLVYGLRVRGMARFRMLSISGGFFLLFAVIGLLPRLLFGNPSAETIRDLINVVRYVALASPPLLLLGFAPPRWISHRFADKNAS